jgi:hypothetical protein
MEKVQKPSNSECDTSSSETFRNYSLYFSDIYINGLGTQLKFSARTTCLQPRFEPRTSLMLPTRKRSHCLFRVLFPWQPVTSYSLRGFKQSCFHAASWLIDISLSRAPNPPSHRNVYAPARGANNYFPYLNHPSLRLSNYPPPPGFLSSRLLTSTNPLGRFLKFALNKETGKRTWNFSDSWGKKTGNLWLDLQKFWWRKERSVKGC